MKKSASCLWVLVVMQCSGWVGVATAAVGDADAASVADAPAVRGVARSTVAAHAHRTPSPAKTADEYYRAGVVAYIKGNNAVALDKFSRALKLQPDHSLARMQLEKIKQETDQKKLREAKDKYNQGLAFYMNGKLNDAISVWEKALVLDPYNTGVQKALDRARAEFRERNVP